MIFESPFRVVHDVLWGEQSHALSRMWTQAAIQCFLYRAGLDYIEKGDIVSSFFMRAWTLFKMMQKGWRWALILGVLLQLPQAQALQPTKCGVPIEQSDDLPMPPGEAEVDMRLEGRSLTLRWSSSLRDILGFDHAARTEQERQAVEATVRALQALPQHFAFDVRAGCKSQGMQYASRVLESAAAVTTMTPVTKEDFLFATLRYECATPDRLHSISSDLFAIFPKIHRLKVRYHFPKSQGEMRMTPKEAVFNGF